MIIAVIGAGEPSNEVAELADEGVEVTGEYTPIEVELTEGGM